MIEILILDALIQKKMTMYALKKFIETFYAAFITPSFGAIKPALRRLQEKDCIVADKFISDGGRLSCRYSITGKGREELVRLLLEDMSKNPSQFFLVARLKLIMAQHLSEAERKRLFLIIKSLAMKFKNSAEECRTQRGFYYDTMLESVINEYENIIRVVGSLEKEHARYCK